MPETGQLLAQVDPVGDVVASVVVFEPDGPLLWRLARTGVWTVVALPTSYYVSHDWLVRLPITIAIMLAGEIACMCLRLSGQRPCLVTVTTSQVTFYGLPRWPWQRARPARLLSAPVSAASVRPSKKRLFGAPLVISFTGQHRYLGRHLFRVPMARRQQADAVRAALESGGAVAGEIAG
jgi:hypothetical protein